MFNQAIAGEMLPERLSTDDDPMFRVHRWLAYLRVLEIEEIKSRGVPQGQEIMRVIRPTSATPSRLATILTILPMLSADIGFTE